jgi:hypothetical protein
MRWFALLPFLFAANLPGFAQEKLPGFESPEKAFQAYVIGAASQDFDLTLLSLTPEAKAYHIGLVVASVPYFFEKKEREKLFADHGIDTSPGDGPAKGQANEKAAEKAFVDAMLQVKNPAKLVRRLTARAEDLAKKLANPDDPAPKSKMPSQRELLSAVTLGTVTITEDAAFAKAKVADPAKSVFVTMPEMIQFRRIKGRWYCDIDPR